MPGAVISRADQVTAVLVTTVLTRRTALTAGTAIAVDLDEGHRNSSANAHLQVRRSSDTAGGCPTSRPSRW
jgi:hypothetical protein